MKCCPPQVDMGFIWVSGIEDYIGIMENGNWHYVGVFKNYVGECQYSFYQRTMIDDWGIWGPFGSLASSVTYFLIKPMHVHKLFGK